MPLGVLNLSKPDGLSGWEYIMGSAGNKEKTLLNR